MLGGMSGSCGAAAIMGGEAEGLLHGLAAVVSAGDKVRPYGVPLITPPAIPVFRAGYTKNPTQGIPRAGFAVL